MGRGGGPNTADSYIGSLISLTSKSEIRYEGILYKVDTENSNIALQNVRSFGTEGRKKDGPQIPASDKVYDYIIFRGSDIKDLQVKSSPPQPPPPQPADPAIISLQQSQPPYPPPSSLGTYNGGLPTAGSSSEPSAPPPPPFMGMPPSQYRSAVPPLYPPAGMQSWGPHPPPPVANGSGLAMPMYWQGYYRPPPAGHMQQHQPMPPQPPPSLAPPPPGQQLQQQGQQAPQGSQVSPLPQQPPASRPPGASGSAPSSSGAVTLASQSQPLATNVLSTSVPSSVAPVAPLMTATAPPVASGVNAPASSAVASTVATPVASSVGTTASAPASGVPVLVASNLATPMQGVSAVITPVAKNPRRIPGISTVPPPTQPPAVGSPSQGPHTPGVAGAPVLSSGALLRPQSEVAQSSGLVATAIKAVAATVPQNQASSKAVEQKLVEPVIVGRLPASLTSSQAAPSQEQVSQPLLPLPTAEQKQQGVPQQRGNHGVPVGQRNRWQGNGYGGNGNYNRRGRGRGSHTGRGVAVANPTQQFTEDFDFSAMNEKFKKDEVWGTLGGKDDEEEEEFDDVHVEDEAESDSAKKILYNKDDFFDSLSCDAIEGGRAERTKFSEQRKIDTETFGAFPVRSRGGRGGRGGRRGGYRGGYYGGGSYGIGRGGGYGRGRGMGRAPTGPV